MINQLNELTTSQLENLKVRLQSIALEQASEINRGQARLDNRLERKRIDSTALIMAQSNLSKAEEVRDELIFAGASAISTG